MLSDATPIVTFTLTVEIPGLSITVPLTPNPLDRSQMKRPAPVSASSVSAALRQAGFNPVRRNKGGLHVTPTRHTGFVRVAADLDDDSAAATMIADVIETLTGLGYLVLQSAPNAAHVSR